MNFEGLNPQFDAVAPQQFVYSTVETAANNLAEMKTAESIGISQVRDFMSRYNLTQAGPLVRVVTTYDQASNRMSFRVGYPFDGPTPTSVVGVQIGQTPSGEAMHVLVEGSSRQVQTAYAQMNAYMQAHRISMRENGLPWEVVHDPGAAGRHGHDAPRNLHAAAITAVGNRQSAVANKKTPRMRKLRGVLHLHSTADCRLPILLDQLQIDGLRTFALGVRQGLEVDALAFGQ